MIDTRIADALESIATSLQSISENLDKLTTWEGESPDPSQTHGELIDALDRIVSAIDRGQN